MVLQPRFAGDPAPAPVQQHSQQQRQQAARRPQRQQLGAHSKKATGRGKDDAVGIPNFSLGLLSSDEEEEGGSGDDHGDCSAAGYPGIAGGTVTVGCEGLGTDGGPPLGLDDSSRYCLASLEVITGSLVICVGWDPHPELSALQSVSGDVIVQPSVALSAQVRAAEAHNLQYLNSLRRPASSDRDHRFVRVCQCCTGKRLQYAL